MASYCVLCDRSFNSAEILLQHKQKSSAHAYDCISCDRHYGSDQALQQHLQDPSAHAPSFECDDCDQSFNSEEALPQHLWDSRIQQQDTETPTGTPLDVFFRSFPTFDYDSSLPPATSYLNLQRYEGWRRGSAESNDAWNRYQDTLQSELYLW